MRALFLFVIAALLTSTHAEAQSLSAKDLRTLFDKAQAVGIDNELRGDIVDRLGFGDEGLLIKDLVVNINGVQHALNAFSISHTSYLLFHTRRYVPEIYIFVEDLDGKIVAGIHGPQGHPVTDTVNMNHTHDDDIVKAEEAFWAKWLADGAVVPAN